MIAKPSLATLAVLLIGWTTPASAEGSCGPLAKVASMDMGIDQYGGAYVPITISGHKFNMLVDTGGIYSMLSEQAAKSLSLSWLNMNRMSLRMYGGVDIDTYVKADDIQLGQLTTRHWKFPIMPDNLPAGVNGTISPDILRNYDVDFDFAASKLNLFSQDHCPGKVAYWTRGEVAAIPVDIDMWGHMTVPVKLDGKEIKATIDTGASRSFMSLETAQDKFDFGDDDSRLKPAAPDLGEKGKAYTYPFNTLSLEGITVANPDVVLVPNRESRIGARGPRFLLGMDTLRQLHMYIAYSEQKLYVTAATADEHTAPVDPAAWTPPPPEIPVSLHCKSPDIEGVFTQDGPPGFVTAKITFGINSTPPAGGNDAVCMVRATKGTVIASATFALAADSSDANARREILNHVDIREEVTGDNTKPDSKAFVFTVQTTDSTPGKLVLDFPVSYR